MLQIKTQKYNTIIHSMFYSGDYLDNFFPQMVSSDNSGKIGSALTLSKHETERSIVHDRRWKRKGGGWTI